MIDYQEFLEADAPNLVLIVSGLLILTFGFWPYLSSTWLSYKILSRFTKGVVGFVAAFMIFWDSQFVDSINVKNLNGAWIFAIVGFLIVFVLPFLSTIILGTYFALLLAFSITEIYLVETLNSSEIRIHYFHLFSLSCGFFLSIYVAFTSSRFVTGILLVTSGVLFFFMGTACLSGIGAPRIIFEFHPSLNGQEPLCSLNGEPEFVRFATATLVVTCICLAVQVTFALFMHHHNRKKLEHRQRGQIYVILDTFSDFLKHITFFFKWQCISELQNSHHRVNGLGYKLADNLHLDYIKQANTITNCTEVLSGITGIETKVKNWLKNKKTQEILNQWLDEIFPKEREQEISQLEDLKKQIKDIVAIGNLNEFKSKIIIKIFVPLGKDQVEPIIIKEESPDLSGILPFLKWDEVYHCLDLTWSKKLNQQKLIEIPLFMDVNRKCKTIQFIPLEMCSLNPAYVDKNKADLDSPYIMSPKEPAMREKIPEESSKAAALAFILVVLTGIVWLLYLPIYGQNYENVLSVIGFIIFYYAELINFALGLIYYINFFYPATRRWKSFQHLPNNHLRPQVDCLIFHYSEDIADTMGTIDGCLKLKTCNGQIRSNIYVCDDGFWEKLPPQDKKYFCSDLCCCGSCGTSRAEGGGYNLINEIFPASVNVLYPSFVSQNPVFEEDLPLENEFLQFIKQEFNVIISKQGRLMKREIKQLLLSHYDNVCIKIAKKNKLYEVPSLRIKVSTMLKLPRSYENKLPERIKNIYKELSPNEKYICRNDCSIASFSYCFTIFIGNESENSISYQKRHKLFIVARIKPKSHHFKAGNINNCIYNEMEHINNRFIAFFDNDMRPEPPFLVRTVPFFYTQIPGGYELDETVSYVQTPQYFTDDTLGPVLDYLSSKNSIFFQAIQKGRDGFDMSAFSGTNALFRAGVLYAIGGLPYGSQTEDALCGHILHRNGYTSVYAEEVLTIGTAPETVASAMVQRMRWCKGSIQILLLSICPEAKHVDIDRELGPIPEFTPVEKYGEAKISRLHKIIRALYALDTKLYPVSAITAICYMFVALLFVWGKQAPLTFTSTKLGYAIFFLTFVPYFLAKVFGNQAAYSGRVSSDDIWISQQTWFSFAFPAVFGIFDACRERATGKGTAWIATGSNSRRSNLEYFNIFMFFALILGIFVAFISMFSETATTQDLLVDFGAIFFAGTIVFQMWPLVSMSLYEYTRDPSKSQSFGRFQIPTFFAYVIFLAAVIGVGYLSSATTACVPYTYN